LKMALSARLSHTLSQIWFGVRSKSRLREQESGNENAHLLVWFDLFASQASFARQPPMSSATDGKPLTPLPASADIQPGSKASANSPTAYALPAETFHLLAGKNKVFQIAVAQMALKNANAPETRNYAAQIFDAYANGYAKLNNIPDTPTGEPATMTDAQLTMS
jgi:hypothetical protein